MIKIFHIFFLISICLSMEIEAQTDSMTWVNGKIIDSNTLKAVPYANIASYSQHLMYAADSTGSFYIQLPVGDSVKVVVLGYYSKVFKIDSVSTQNNDISFFPLNRSSIMLSNVDINLQRKLFDTEDKLESKSSGFDNSNLHLPKDIVMYDKSKDIIPASYKPVFKSRPPLVVFFFHPLSYINYFTSKKERMKRKMSKIIYSEKKMLHLSNKLIEEVSGFEGDELQQFTIYCNKSIKIKANDTNSTLKQKVFMALENYMAAQKN